MTSHAPAEGLVDAVVHDPATLEHGPISDLAKSHDLMPKMMPFLDRHLIYPLLQFCKDQELLPEIDVLKAEYALLKPTKMADFVANLYQKINDTDDIPAAFSEKKDQVMAELESLGEASAKIQELLEDKDIISSFRQDKIANLQFLKDNHGVTDEMVDSLLKLGQAQYQCGNYVAASDLLYSFRVLSTDSGKTSEATWGKLACEILSANWESAMEEIIKVKDDIETKLFMNPVSQLQHRTWLIHWALFPLFNYEPARDILTDLFFSPSFINTIQTSCPWILRYLAAAVITNRGKGSGGRTSIVQHKQFKELVKVVKQELYEYKDPVTEFVAALHIDFDFEEAQRKLGEAEEVLRGDFFLLDTAEGFVDSARHLISEVYCRIHQRIDIKDLSKRLNLSQDDGEKWIVNLIRDTRVDAKIDYKDGTVIMNHPPQSVYQQVIEKTKGGFFRTQVLNAAVSIK